MSGELLVPLGLGEPAGRQHVDSSPGAADLGAAAGGGEGAGLGAALRARALRSAICSNSGNTRFLLFFKSKVDYPVRSEVSFDVETISKRRRNRQIDVDSMSF